MKRCIEWNSQWTNATRDSAHIHGEIADSASAQTAARRPRKLYTVPVVHATMTSEMMTSSDRAAVIESPAMKSHSA